MDLKLDKLNRLTGISHDKQNLKYRHLRRCTSDTFQDVIPATEQKENKYKDEI